MTKRVATLMFGALLLAGILCGCLSFGGGDETVQQMKTTTLGQEFQDLAGGT